MDCRPKLALQAKAGVRGDLRLDELRIVCPGDVSSPLDEKILVLGISRLTSSLAAREAQKMRQGYHS